MRPDRRSLGLGGLLIGLCYRAARDLGYRRAIHALMHEENHSRRIGGDAARVFRRYTLYSRPHGAIS